MGRMKDLLEHCDNIAIERYGMDFYHLPEETQNIVTQMALQRYKDRYADECDAAYERWKERNIPLTTPAEICAVPCPKCSGTGYYWIKTGENQADKEPCDICHQLDS